MLVRLGSQPKKSFLWRFYVTMKCQLTHGITNQTVFKIINLSQIWDFGRPIICYFFFEIFTLS